VLLRLFVVVVVVVVVPLLLIGRRRRLRLREGERWRGVRRPFTRRRADGAPEKFVGTPDDDEYDDDDDVLVALDGAGW
jgi:hypothetical protein